MLFPQKDTRGANSFFSWLYKRDQAHPQEGYVLSKWNYQVFSIGSLSLKLWKHIYILSPAFTRIIFIDNWAMAFPNVQFYTNWAIVKGKCAVLNNTTPFTMCVFGTYFWSKKTFCAAIFQPGSKIASRLKSHIQCRDLTPFLGGVV